MEKKTLLKIVSWMVMLTVLIVLVVSVDWRGTYEVIQKGDPRFMGLAVLVTLARFVLWSWKWQKTISPLAPLSITRIFPVLMTGVFLNQITPGRDTGGEPVRAYYISKFSGVKKRKVLATIIIDKSGNYIAVGSFIGFAMLFITAFMKVSSSIKIVMEGILLIFLLGVLSAVYVKKNTPLPGVPKSLLKKFYYFKPLKMVRKFFPTYASFEDYVMERVSEFITTFRNLLKEKKNVRDNLLLSYLIWFMVFVKTYLVFLAFGEELSIFLITAVESISILLGILSFLPGGIGATEITMIALFRSAGVSVEIATAATIVSRGIYYAFSLGLGYISFLYLKLLPEKI